MFSRAQLLVLYLFGRSQEVLSSRFPMTSLPLSKIAFIEMVLSSGLVEKSERALYRNLQLLQETGFLIYDNRFLRFSKKGKSEYLRLRRHIYPFLGAEAFVHRAHTIRGIQTTLLP